MPIELKIKKNKHGKRVLAYRKGFGKWSSKRTPFRDSVTDEQIKKKLNDGMEKEGLKFVWVK